MSSAIPATADDRAGRFVAASHRGGRFTRGADERCRFEGCTPTCARFVDKGADIAGARNFTFDCTNQGGRTEVDLEPVAHVHGDHGLLVREVGG